jgi:hypothetical protein
VMPKRSRVTRCNSRLPVPLLFARSPVSFISRSSSLARRSRWHRRRSGSLLHLGSAIFRARGMLAVIASPVFACRQNPLDCPSLTARIPALARAVSQASTHCRGHVEKSGARCPLSAQLRRPRPRPAIYTLRRLRSSVVRLALPDRPNSVAVTAAPFRSSTCTLAALRGCDMFGMTAGIEGRSRQ